MLQNSSFIFMAGYRKIIFQIKKMLWVRFMDFKKMLKRTAKMRFQNDPVLSTNFSICFSCVTCRGVDRTNSKRASMPKIGISAFYNCLKWKGNNLTVQFWQETFFSFVKSNGWNKFGSYFCYFQALTHISWISSVSLWII